MSNTKKAKRLVPRFVYHAAPECVMGAIARDGLKSPWGEIYAAGEPEHALQFMWMRLLHHMHDAKNMDCPKCGGVGQLPGDPTVDGYDCPACSGTGAVMMPEIVDHESIAVYTIDTDKTDVKLWSVGVDHSPAFFPNMTSWCYGAGSIPVSAIVAVDQYVAATEEGSA